MPASPPILFDPTPDIAAAIIAAMTDPSVSFDQLAAAAQTSSEALSLWMQRPEIRERIESTDRAATWRTRLIAGANLHPVIPALVKILRDYTEAPTPVAPPSNPPQSSPPHSSPTTRSTQPSAWDTEAQSFRHALLELRRAETTRKSATLLLTLTRTRPTPSPDLAPQPPREPRAQARDTDLAAQAHTITPHPQTHATTVAEAEALRSLGFERPQPSPSNPQSEIPNPQSIDSLLAQLAPHLEVIAQKLGIDPDDPNPAPEPDDPAPTAPSRHRGPAHQSDPPRNPARPGDRELATTSANEHWP